MGVPVISVDPHLPTVTAPPSPAATAFDPAADVRTELERQVTAYVELGIPALLGEDPAGFRDRVAPLAEVATAPYLLGGVDTGSEFCGVPPEKALVAMTGHGRTPLTLDEGVALVVVRPDMLRPNACFSLLASRTGTNQRVPAVWISERRAKLGWCWDRNPHTWLGAASAADRLTATD